jgi:hypothetical protein
MASTWAATASNETISFTTLQNGVDTGALSQKAAIPVSNEQINKDDANTYVNINTLFAPYAAKSSNQLVVKSDLISIVIVNDNINYRLTGITNNETTTSPIQLFCGYREQFTQGGITYLRFGAVSRSTNYGATYTEVVSISDALLKIKFMPAFRHASYLTVPPFLAVGEDGRIITNSVTDCSSWITVSSPTTQPLYDISFNSSGVGIIVGASRILKTNTNNRINSWSIVNSVSALWRSAASDGSRFVAVGDNSSILTGASNGTTWSTGTMPPLSPTTISLQGVTYHTDSFFYAVGFTATNSPYIMRSSDSGFNWETFNTTGDSFIGALYSIKSINGRLVVGGLDYQYQITGGVVTRFIASISGRNILWADVVKDANSNGFDMVGYQPGPITSNIKNGFYSNF